MGRKQITMNIKRTTYPSEPFKNHKEWREWMSKEMTAEDKFEAEFFRIWSEYKASIQRARTK